MLISKAAARSARRAGGAQNEAHRARAPCCFAVLRRRLITPSRGCKSRYPTSITHARARCRCGYTALVADQLVVAPETQQQKECNASAECSGMKVCVEARNARFITVCFGAARLRRPQQRCKRAYGVDMQHPAGVRRVFVTKGVKTAVLLTVRDRHLLAKACAGKRYFFGIPAHTHAVRAQERPAAGEHCFFLRVQSTAWIHSELYEIGTRTHRPAGSAPSIITGRS